jgi:UDP-2,3-diacylglucosamine hydrolase
MKTTKIIQLPIGKKIYFASDFHLGAPDFAISKQRELRLIAWLKSIENDAYAVILMGDIFDFWFEYKHVIPKGYSRFFGQLASMSDAGIEIIAFTGNHDMWMFDYLQVELGIEIIRTEVDWEVNGKKFHLGHGDGLGPYDGKYKILKRFFANKVCQRLFAFLHPWIGFSIAMNWSKTSRIYNQTRTELVAIESEWLVAYCQEQETVKHRDFYIFGHRHLPLEIPILDGSLYINLGEWLHYNTYAEFDGHESKLKTYNP